MYGISIFSSVIADVMLIACYVLMALTLVAVAFSLAKSVKCRSFYNSDNGGVPTTKIAYGCIGFTVLCLVATFLAGSADTIKVNGEDYASWFWLKATDMLIDTSIVLFIIAVVGVAYGLSGHIRKTDPRKAGHTHNS